MSRSEANQVMQLALGRVFRIMSRPARPGDIQQYEKCRSAILEAADALGIQAHSPASNHRPGWNFGNLCLD